MPVSVDGVAGDPFTGQLVIIVDRVVQLIGVLLLLDDVIYTLSMDVQINLRYSVHRFLGVFSAYLRGIFDCFRIHSSVINVDNLATLRSSSCCPACIWNSLFLNLSDFF